MTSDKKTSTLLVRVQEFLMDISKNPDSGLDSRAKDDIKGLVSHETPDGEASAKERFVIASDGLSLKQKSLIEKSLVEALKADGVDVGKLSIFFRRKKSPASSGPAPSTSKKSPFGLSIDKRAIPGVREVIVVASGKGGVGKSTVSTNLAVTLSRLGQRVGFLDADIYGPSAPTMLGAKGPLGVSDGEKLLPVEKHGVKIVSFGFIAGAHEPIIWRGPMLGKAIDQMCFRTDWGELDYLIVDLPPGTGDVQISLIESIPIHGALIVTTPQNVALLDAHRAQSMFESLKVPVVGVVENMSSFHCPSCGHEEPLFGEGGGEKFSEERGLSFLGKIPLLKEVRIQGDLGAPASLGEDGPVKDSFESLAHAVLKLGSPVH